MKELRHKDPAAKLSRVEDNALDRHFMTGGADDDFLVYDATNAKLIGKTPAEVSSIIQASIDHGNLAGLSDDDHSQYVLHTEVDDSPVDGVTADPISSNWAYDHGVAADPHTGYRLESADHSHQTTGAQAGKIDHGLALNGLGGDDHTQYILHSLAGTANDFLVASGANTYVKKTLAETGAILEADLDHGSIQGLGGDDHTQYIKDSEFTAADEIIVGTGAGTFGQVTLGASQFLAKKSTGVATNVTATQARTILNVENGAAADLTGLEIVTLLEALSAGNRLDHGAGLTGLGDDDHTQYMLDTVAEANAMLYSVSDNTPAALVMVSSRIPARLASGNIIAATGAQILALLSGANLDVGGYDIRGATLTADGLTSGRVVFAGASGVLSDDSDFLFSVDTLTVTKIGAFELTGAINAGSGSAQINTTGGAKGLVIKSTNDGATGAALILDHVSASPANGEGIARIIGRGRDSVGDATEYGRFFFLIEDKTQDSEDGSMLWTNISGGSQNEVMKLSSLGALWSDLSVDTLTYKVSGTQVVSARSAAVADPTDPASTQARLTDLLGRLRTHGLIAT